MRPCRCSWPAHGSVASVAIVVFAAVLLVKTMRDDLAAHDARIEAGLSLRARLHAAIPAGAAVLWSWRVPEPSFASRVMSSDIRDELAVARLYPRDGVYDVWQRHIEWPLAKDWDFVVIGRTISSHFRLRSERRLPRSMITSSWPA